MCNITFSLRTLQVGLVPNLTLSCLVAPGAADNSPSDVTAAFQSQTIEGAALITGESMDRDLSKADPVNTPAVSAVPATTPDSTGLAAGALCHMPHHAHLHGSCTVLPTPLT